MNSKRIYSFDILRFFAILLIAIMHWHWQYCPQAYIGVELCFMITGYFLATNFEKYKKQNFVTSIIKRIGSFYPYYVVAISLYLFHVQFFKLEQFIASLTFFNCIGFTPNLFIGAYWFIGAYAVSILFFISLIKIASKKTVIFINGVLVILGFYAMMANSTAMNINLSLEKDFYIGILPFGIVRGLVDVGFGFILGNIKEICKSNPFSNFSDIIQLGTILYLLYIIFHKVDSKFDSIVCLIIGTMLFSFSFKDTWLAKTMEKIGNSKLRFLFNLSMPIYVFHYVILQFLLSSPICLLSTSYPKIFCLIYVGLTLICCIFAKIIINELFKLKERRKI